MQTNIINNYIKEHYRALYIAINHHKTHKNMHLTFVDLPYLIDIYKDKTDKQVLKKSTQSGITEYLIVLTITNTKYERRNVFYVMPTESLKNQFVNTRFEQSVSHTPLYSRFFKDSSYNNKSVKQIGNASIFFAISNSRSSFTSFPADTLIIDELDECNLENVEMAPERLAFSSEPREIRVANPTYPGIGIDFEWNKSDKKHWFVPCDCGHKFAPDFFKHVVRHVKDDIYTVRDKDFDFAKSEDARMICDKCGRPVHRYKKGEWIKEKDSIISGRHLNQLFSSKRKLRDIIDQFNDSLANEIKTQRFYNGTLGRTYLGQGAQINDEMIQRCTGNYLMPTFCNDACVIGIDVGKKMHTTIFRLIKNGGKLKMQLVFADELLFKVTKDKIDIDELVILFRKFNIKAGVIDARPEDRLSRLICQNFTKMWRCIYLTESPKDVVDMKNKIYKTDRTCSMDGVKEQITLRHMVFPSNITCVNGFVKQLKAPMRIFRESATTTGRWTWYEGKNPDHYFHSINYACIAKKLLTQ